MDDNMMWEVTFPRARFLNLRESGLIAAKRFPQLTDKNA
jgi:hypothetical protein